MVGLMLCKCSVVFIDSLLLHCTVTNDLNSFLLTIFGVKLVMSQKEVDVYICWQECLDVIETVRSVMQTLFALHGQLGQRYNRTLNSINLSNLELKFLFLQTQYQWSNVFFFFFLISQQIISGLMCLAINALRKHKPHSTFK